VIIDAETASVFEDFIDSGLVHKLTAPEDLGGYAGQVTLAKDYLKAMRIRTPAAEALDRLFEEGGFDALVHPTRATVAYPLGKLFDAAYPEIQGGGEPISGAANLVGLPSLALPSGFGADGLPTSISFTGRAWGENRLLALGRAYQSRTHWHRRRPPV
jgi:aspartyl-tRNA(Asn)/glutamyl-tRNA(Gln) amidotransferase subunit A